MTIQLYPSPLRVEGVYDIKTYSFLKDEGVRAFVFDLRPLSMNFLQEYVLLDLLRLHYSPDVQYFLKFQGEKDFVIRKIIEDVRPLISYKNLFLEFSDNQETAFYDQFKMPYYWHFENEHYWKEKLKSPLLKGVILSFDLLVSYSRKGLLKEFLKNFSPSLVGSKIEILLKLHWWSAEDEKYALDTLKELIQFKYFSFTIDTTVESSYRRIDFDKLEKKLSLWTNKDEIAPAQTLNFSSEKYS